MNSISLNTSTQLDDSIQKKHVSSGKCKFNLPAGKIAIWSRAKSIMRKEYRNISQL